MFQNLMKAAKVIRVQNAAAAGTTTLNGATVDMLGFECATAIYGVGALTAGQQTKLKWQDGTAANGSDMADVAASGTPPGAFMPDGDSNKVLVAELVRPAPGPTKSAVSYPVNAAGASNSGPPTGGGYIPNRYIRPVLVRGTQNAVVDFGIVILYNKLRSPTQSTEQDTSVSGSPNVIVDAAQGTAN